MANPTNDAARVLPTDGRSVLAHVVQLLAEAAATIDHARGALHPLRRLRLAEREQLRRDLAGVIGTCEMVRLWLEAGAPR